MHRFGVIFVFGVLASLHKIIAVFSGRSNKTARQVWPRISGGLEITVERKFCGVEVEFDPVPCRTGSARTDIKKVLLGEWEAEDIGALF